MTSVPVTSSDPGPDPARPASVASEDHGNGSGDGGGGGLVEDKVRKILALIRPAVQSDGGDLELVEITGQGVVRIRLHGACVGCPSSLVTLQMGIERNLKAHVPEVRAVEAVA